jgi:hypothetical protein
MRRRLQLSFLVLSALFLGLGSATASASGLEVRNAVYLLNPARVVVTLVNTGSQVVTAYGMEVIVTDDGKTLMHFGVSKDFLNLVVTDRQQTGNAGSWSGAIEPGQEYVETIPESGGNVPPGTATVQATVSGVLNSDGTFGSTGDTMMMRHVIDQRQASLHTESYVIKMLQDSSDNTDDQKRAAALSERFASLTKNPTGGDSAKTLLGPPDPAVLSEVQQNIGTLSGAHGFESYTSYLQARNQIRAALLATAHE